MWYFVLWCRNHLFSLHRINLWELSLCASCVILLYIFWVFVSVVRSNPIDVTKSDLPFIWFYHFIYRFAEDCQLGTSKLVNMVSIYKYVRINWKFDVVNSICDFKLFCFFFRTITNDLIRRINNLLAIVCFCAVINIIRNMQLYANESVYCI